MSRNEYYFSRVEHYRARGEDYSDAHEWAQQDTDARYGKPVVE